MIAGSAELRAGRFTHRLERFESILVPASTGPYTLSSSAAYQALVATLPA
jgi:hypothetical protein